MDQVTEPHASVVFGRFRVFRKVTNGFRSDWGAETYAAFRSVVSIAKANRRSILYDLRNALAAESFSIAT